MGISRTMIGAVKLIADAVASGTTATAVIQNKNETNSNVERQSCNPTRFELNMPGPYFGQKNNIIQTVCPRERKNTI